MQLSEENSDIQDLKVTIGDGCDAREYSGTFLVASLMLYVSKSDGAISGVETDCMIAQLSDHVGVSNAVALDQLKEAIMFLADDKQAALKLREMGGLLPAAQRREILQMMSTVSMADGIIAPGERESISIAAHLLGLDQADINSAMATVTGPPTGAG